MLLLLLTHEAAVFHSPVVRRLDTPASAHISMCASERTGYNRRSVSSFLAQACFLSSIGHVLPAAALFESKEQLAVTSVANVQQKVATMTAEVSEVVRKRTKMIADAEDDAYVFRFARAVRAMCSNRAANTSFVLRSEFYARPVLCLGA